MRTIPFAIVFVLGSTAAVSACSTLIGADFDRPVADSNPQVEPASNPLPGAGDHPAPPSIVLADGGPEESQPTPTVDAGDAGPTFWKRETVPVARDLNAVWGSGGSDVYVVGKGGALLHSPGNGTWSLQTTGTTVDFNGVWGSGAGDVYVVGDRGTILHGTGAGDWAPQATGTNTIAFTFVWGSGPNDVYVLGHDDLGSDVLYHSTGRGDWTATNAIPFGTQVGRVWGTGPNDVYLMGSGLGNGSNILHTTGNGMWTAESAMYDSARSICSIWGRDAKHLFALACSNHDGAFSSIFESTGDGTWHHESGPANIDTVWMAAGGEVVAVGFDGTVSMGMPSTEADAVALHWEPVGSDGAYFLEGVWGASLADFYVIGLNALILHHRR
jgi:hypothetical protein